MNTVPSSPLPQIMLPSFPLLEKWQKPAYIQCNGQALPRKTTFLFRLFHVSGKFLKLKEQLITPTQK